MPDEVEIKPLSTLVAETRAKLLDTFTTKLDELLGQRLVPAPEGIPFVNCLEGPPQLIAIKKLINCLFYAEKGFSSLEKINTSTIKGIAMAGPLTTHAIVKIKNAIEMLEQASPELQWVLMENYATIAPLFYRTKEVIEHSGWVREFSEMETTDKASSIIDTGLGLFGTDQAQWNMQNPLLATFNNIAELMEMIAQSSDGLLSEQGMGKVRTIINGLENNPFINQLNISHFEESKAINDILKWFKNIQEDGFKFTQNSLETYLVWSKNYLPLLIQYADQLEHQNYLKTGTLSQKICPKADELGLKINQMLDSDSLYDIKARVAPTASLLAHREQLLHANQQKSMRQIMTFEAQKNAALEFYAILETNRAHSFSQIPEVDRIELRRLYPHVQRALAHVGLSLENECAGLLNKTGPEREERSWFRKGVNFLSRLVVNSDVDKLVRTAPAVAAFLDQSIAAEQFKFHVGEKKRAALIGAPPVDETILEGQRNLVREELKVSPAGAATALSEIVAFKHGDLNTFRGTLSYLQNKKLSVKTNEIRETLALVISRHVKTQNSPTTDHRVINENDDVAKQIKKIDENLAALEEQLVAFESVNLNIPLTINILTFKRLAEAATDLHTNISILTPNAKKTLTPIMQRVTLLVKNLSDKTEKSIQELENDETSILKLIKTNGLAYAQTLSTARTTLLGNFQTHLSPLISTHLKPQKNGVPFTNIDKDAPQIATIKKMINSLYYAEAAIKTWQAIDTSTQIGKVAAAHQGVSALSQVYKVLNLYADITPEIQDLMQENHEILEPVLKGAKELIAQSGWTPQFDSLEVTKKTGSILGQAAALVQPKKNALVTAVADLPGFLNTISNTINGNPEIFNQNKTISQSQIDAIGNLIDDSFSFSMIVTRPKALWSIYKLYQQIQKEIPYLKEASVRAYQRWLKQGYPDLLILMDQLETANYMKPGTLSGQFTLEIDLFNDQLNQYIDKEKDIKLKKINLSYDLLTPRVSSLHATRKEHYFDLLNIEEQRQAAKTFFSILNNHKGMSLSEYPAEDLINLKNAFAGMQTAMATSNLDVANQLVTVLNAPGTSASKSDPFITKVLKQESFVENYLNERQKSYQLKINIIHEQINYLNEHSGLKKSVAPSIEDFRTEYKAHQAQQPKIESIELTPTPSSSIHSVRGNISYVQELKISGLLADIRDKLDKRSETFFSARVLAHINKPEGQPLFVINKNDPRQVQQLKELKNGLYNLQQAFMHFESLNKKDSLVSQVKALMEVSYEANQLSIVIEHLSPELKEHYGPITSQLLGMAKKIQAIEYNRKDWDELVYIATYTKDVMNTRTPKDSRLKKAFFESEHYKKQLLIDDSKPIIKRAAVLGTKYVHLASPELEKAIDYLRKGYETDFGEQESVIHHYTREQLASNATMDEEIKRLQDKLERNYGINFSTLGAMGDLIRQIQRVSAQGAELADIGNQLISKHYTKIKEKKYEEVIAKLSQEEDYLGLKPGTLILPTMSVVNQLFLSAALEIEMPFADKLALLNESTYLTILIKQTNKDLEKLEKQLQSDPTNADCLLQIDIKKDKVDFLKQQISLHKEKDPTELKNALIDVQFEVYLRNHLVSSGLRQPIVKEYESLIRSKYAVLPKTNIDDLQVFLAKCAKDELAVYLFIGETYRMLQKFSLKLPEEHGDLKDYIVGINLKLTNSATPIERRVLDVKFLPRDKEFISKLSSVDQGIGFLKVFTQFVERFFKTIAESVKTKTSFSHVWYKQKMEQTIKNCERVLDAKRPDITDDDNLPNTTSPLANK